MRDDPERSDNSDGLDSCRAGQAGHLHGAHDAEESHDPGTNDPDWRAQVTGVACTGGIMTRKEK